MIQFLKNSRALGARMMVALLFLTVAKAASANSADFVTLCAGKYDGPDAALITFEAAGWQLASPEISAEFSRANVDAEIATSLVDGSFGDLVKESVDFRVSESDVADGFQYLDAMRNFEGRFATQEEKATKTSILLRMIKGEGAERVFVELRFPKVYEKDKPLVCTWLTSNRPTGLAMAKSIFPDREIEAGPIWLSAVEFNLGEKSMLVGSVVLIDATALTEELGTELRFAMRLKIENADFRTVPSP